ncbi:Bro-N domain-containing protein [Azospirillum sp. TSH100]|uniref:BRO-N domain-containing protein n=1 Tax=Azospirillum sp. TSH100 TaxID=652764 RepID=UPI0018EE583B|nr:Bro-N domain-containing protein [Azospirillum sp. TSH100]
MSAHLTPFLFEENHLLRSLMIDDEPWFVAVDVCRALGIANSRDAVNKLDDDEKGVGLTDTPGGQQEMAVISESGLYTVILRSRDATTPGTLSHRFRRWVTAEVLPAIRRTGAFRPQPQPLDLEARREATRLARELVKETNPAIRRMLHAMLVDTTARIGVAAPALEALGRDGPSPSPLAAQLFLAIRAAEGRGLRLNHSADPTLLAVNLNELNRHAASGALAIGANGDMRRALKRESRFRGIRTVRSRITGATIKAWVFAHDE